MGKKPRENLKFKRVEIMKKSKFLKKSLAMLLALMLVVAMIPLSAVASEPALQQVRATADNQTVLLTRNGNTYTGTYRAGAQTIELQLVVGTKNLVYYTDTTTTTPTDRRVDFTGNLAEFSVRRDQYSDAEGNVSIEFSVADASDAKVREYYTVELTPVEASTETEILEFALDRTVNAGTPNENTVPNIGEVNIGVDFINVTVPYDAASATYTIRNMVLSDRATATVNGSTVSGVQNGNPKIEVKNEDKITVSNGNHNQTYTLHITVASGFTSFTTEEGLDAVLFPEDNAIAVLLPYGYTTGKDTVTITPSYELDYLSAEAEWANGEAVTVKTANVNKSVFNSFKGTHTTATNDWDWDGAKAESASFYSFIDGEHNWNNVKAVDTVWVQYTDDTTRTYNVYLFETKLNNATAITGLTIGSEQAVIDEENKTIDIVLPAGTDLSNLVFNSTTTRFTMTASNGANITFPALVNDSLNETTTPNTGDNRTATDTYTDNWKVDAREPISVLVKSEDNKCSGNEQYYTLNITASDNYEDAKITGMSIQSPDGKYTYDATPDANGKIVLQVPYYVYSKAELEGWKLFYTKTVGTSVTVNGAALPVSGAALTGGESWIGVPGSNVAGADITANMIGEDLSQNTRVYNVQIDRVAAKTDSTLKNFSIIGDTENNEADNTYAATIDQSKKTISAGVAWAAYQQWDWTEFEAIAEAAEDANARIFFKNVNDNLVELVNSGEDDATGVTHYTTGAGDIDLYNGTDIYVLSEQMWVNLEAKGVIHEESDRTYIKRSDWDANVNESDRTYYNVY